MPYKKDFVAGDKLLATELIDNFTILEPVADYYISVGYLTGGINVSALSVFNTLMNGSNDGKLSINIDGVDNNDIHLPLANPDGTEINQVEIAQAGNIWEDIGTSEGDSLGQTFTIPTGMANLTALTIHTDSSGTTHYVKVYTDATRTTLLGSGSVITSATGNQKITLDTPINVAENDVLYAVFYVSVGGRRFYRSGSQSYSGGYLYVDNVQQDVWEDLKMIVHGESSGDFTDINDLTPLLQSAIRGATGAEEVVEYDTDHFKITSVTEGSSSVILKMTSPSTGTDISGNDTDKYFDLGEGATETIGTLSEDRVIKTGDDGRLDGSLLQLEQMTTTARDLITAYTGQVIYNSTTNKINLYNGTTWEVVTSS